MPKQVDSLFTRYEFTEQELVDACNVSPITVQFLQNELAKLADEKLTRAPGGMSVEAYLQGLEYLRGQIDLLVWLLAAFTSPTEGAQ